MARRLILDTAVLIRAERDNRPPIGELEDDDDVAIAAITVAELHTGVELAATRHRASREGFVQSVLALIPVEAYTDQTARGHAALLAYCHRTGTPRGAHDLIIAATALATGRTILTTDRRAGFADLPGVKALEIS